MIRKAIAKEKGFTLVEVIVVAVIVAVLALVAIQLYQGYVKDSRQNTAENLAASAAGHVQACIASGGADPGDVTWAGQSSNVCNTSGGNTTTFVVPANAEIAFSGGAVTAKVATVPSTGVYRYKEASAAPPVTP